MEPFIVIDPAITHGAVVKVHTNKEGGRKFTPLYTWEQAGTGKNRRWGMHKSLYDYVHLADCITEKIKDNLFYKQYPPMNIIIDYAENTSAFAQQRKLIQYTSFLMGNIHGMLIESPVNIIHLNPSEIRQWVGVKSRATKQEVWLEFFHKYPWYDFDGEIPDTTDYKKLERNALNSDLVDCYIMGMYICEVEHG